MAVVSLYTLYFLVLCTQVLWRRENKNISWNFILPLLFLLKFQTQDVWLTLQLNCCVPYGSFPKLGIEGRCLPSCNPVKKMAGLFQYLDLWHGSTETDAWYRQETIPPQRNWVFFLRCAEQWRLCCISWLISKSTRFSFNLVVSTSCLWFGTSLFCMFYTIAILK